MSRELRTGIFSSLLFGGAVLCFDPIGVGKTTIEAHRLRQAYFQFVSRIDTTPGFAFNVAKINL